MLWDRPHDYRHLAAEYLKAVLKDMADAWSRLAEWWEKRHAKDQPDGDRRSQ